MRSAHPTIHRRLLRNLRESGTLVALHWTTFNGVLDDVTGALLSGTSSAASETVRAFVHPVEAHSRARQFLQLAEGSLVLDLPPTVELDGRSGLRLEVPAASGEYYTARSSAGVTPAQWDALLPDGRRLARTLIVEPMA